MKYSYDNNQLISVSKDGSVLVWDTENNSSRSNSNSSSSVSNGSNSSNNKNSSSSNNNNKSNTNYNKIASIFYTGKIFTSILMTNKFMNLNINEITNSNNIKNDNDSSKNRIEFVVSSFDGSLSYYYLENKQINDIHNDRNNNTNDNNKNSAKIKTDNSNEMKYDIINYYTTSPFYSTEETMQE